MVRRLPIFIILILEIRQYINWGPEFYISFFLYISIRHSIEIMVLDQGAQRLYTRHYEARKNRCVAAVFPSPLSNTADI